MSRGALNFRSLLGGLQTWMGERPRPRPGRMTGADSFQRAKSSQCRDTNVLSGRLIMVLEHFSLMLTRSLRVGGNWRILSDKLCVGANESCARGPGSFAHPLFVEV